MQKSEEKSEEISDKSSDEESDENSEEESDENSVKKSEENFDKESEFDEESMETLEDEENLDKSISTKTKDLEVTLLGTAAFSLSGPTTTLTLMALTSIVTRSGGGREGCI